MLFLKITLERSIYSIRLKMNKSESEIANKLLDKGVTSYDIGLAVLRKDNEVLKSYAKKIFEACELDPSLEGEFMSQMETLTELE